MIEQVCPMPKAGRAPALPIGARKIRVNQFIGVGSLVQLAGVAVFFAIGYFVGTQLSLAVGLLVCALLMIVGNRLSKAWHCSACGTKLLNHGVTICPGCRQGLQ